MNDGSGRIKVIRLPVCVYRPGVIPAEAGIQEGAGGMVNGLRRSKDIPAMREWIEQTTGFLGGLFPTPLYHLHPCRRACAGMTKGDSGQRRAPLPSRPCLPQAGHTGLHAHIMTTQVINNTSPSFQRKLESSGLIE